MQTGAVFLNDLVVNLELPDAEDELLPGVKWGAIEAFPSPAHWVYLVLARRVQGNPIRYKLGNTLPEEVGACILGGHGIPANIGVAAFESLKAKGAFSEKNLTAEQFYTWLTEPLTLKDRSVRYRFAKQKAAYLAAAMKKLQTEDIPLDVGLSLRNWLLAIPGIGLKTASWITRNWLGADDVAILDIHILRAGILGGFLNPNYTVEKDYIKLENEFLKFSEAVGLPTSELDAEIWWQMSNSSRTVHNLLSSRNQASSAITSARTKQRHADPHQATFLI